MISLEQIKLLEQKVEQALKKIIVLQNNNTTLQTENEELKVEIELLKEQCERLEKDEEKIEQGILNVLDKLNNVEDTVRQAQSEPSHVYESAQSVDRNEEQSTYSKTEYKEKDQYLDSEIFTEEVYTVEDPLANINDDDDDETTISPVSGLLDQATQTTNLDIF